MLADENAVDRRLEIARFNVILITRQGVAVTTGSPPRDRTRRRSRSLAEPNA